VARRLSRLLAIAVLAAGTILYTGFLGFPWPALILVAVLLTYQITGPRLALFALGVWAAHSDRVSRILRPIGA